MQRVPILALLSLALLGGVARRTWGESTPPPAPMLQCDEPLYDFGEISNLEYVEHTFVLRNHGETPVRISAVKPSCGCTVANLSRKVIGPGSEVALEAKLDLRRRRGHQKISIRIESDDPQRPQYWVYLEGVATSELEVIPSKVYFGPLREGEEASQEIRILYRGEGALKLTSVLSSSTNFDVRVRAAKVVGRGRRFKLVVTARSLPRGTTVGSIRVRTDHPRHTGVDIPVSATVLDELMCAPSEIVLDLRKPDAAKRYVVVRAGLVKDFEVREVVPPSPDMSVRIMKMGDDAYRIELSNLVPDPGLDGTFLRILTDAEEMPEIHVPFHIIPRKALPHT